VVCDEVDCAGTQLEHQGREDEPANHSSRNDGQHEGDDLISKTPAAR